MPVRQSDPGPPACPFSTPFVVPISSLDGFFERPSFINSSPQQKTSQPKLTGEDMVAVTRPWRVLLE